MNNKKKLIIISNEKTSINNNEFYCDNIDMKSIPEGLNSNFEIKLITRKTNIKRSHQIKINDICISSNIFNFLLNIFNTFKIKNKKYFIISITPYTFVAYLFLIIFGKKVFVYLRSDGYEEYKYYSKIFGPDIYQIMFMIAGWRSTLISCREHILKGKKGEIVAPSQLNEKWFQSRKNPNLEKIQLLYIGRLRIEKGIFSLLEIIKNLKIEFNMSIVGASSNEKEIIKQKKVELINIQNKNESIINIHDSHNIFILPSFTEGHPQVIDESLSRFRPVIIFEEISHVIGNREGVFVCKRSSESLSEKIHYIMKNYRAIQEKMSKNILPTKEDFLKKLYLILNKTNN